MKSIVRAKKYPDNPLGALSFLRSIMEHLKEDIDGCWHPSHSLSPYELLGEIEAYSTVQMAHDAIKEDLHRDEMRRLWAKSLR